MTGAKMTIAYQPTASTPDISGELREMDTSAATQKAASPPTPMTPMISPKRLGASMLVSRLGQRVAETTRSSRGRS